MAPDGPSPPFSKELTLALSRRQNLKGVIFKKKGFSGERFRLLAGRISGGGGRLGTHGLGSTEALGVQEPQKLGGAGGPVGSQPKITTVTPGAPPANSKRIKRGQK